MRGRLLLGLVLLIGAAAAGCGGQGGDGRGGVAGGLSDPKARINAAGETPSWSARVRPGELSVTVGDGAPLQAKPSVIDRGKAGAGWSGALEKGHGSIALDVMSTPCRDSATGMTYPLTATAGVQGRRYAGCAAPPGQGLGPRT